MKQNRNDIDIRVGDKNIKYLQKLDTSIKLHGNVLIICWKFSSAIHIVGRNPYSMFTIHTSFEAVVPAYDSMRSGNLFPCLYLFHVPMTIDAFEREVVICLWNVYDFITALHVRIL